MKYEYFPPVGTGNVVKWENHGWDKDDAIVYLQAYYQNLVLPEQELLANSRGCGVLARAR